MPREPTGRPQRGLDLGTRVRAVAPEDDRERIAAFHEERRPARRLPRLQHVRRERFDDGDRRARIGAGDVARHVELHDLTPVGGDRARRRSSRRCVRACLPGTAPGHVRLEHVLGLWQEVLDRLGRERRGAGTTRPGPGDGDGDRRAKSGALLHAALRAPTSSVSALPPPQAVSEAAVIVAAAVRARTCRMGSTQSSRSGCSRTIFSYSGWKLRYPETCEPTCSGRELRHLGVDEHRVARRRRRAAAPGTTAPW